MLRWFASKEGAAGADIPRVASPEALENLLTADFVVFFKHSPSCGVSWGAHREVKRFAAANPDVPIHMVLVREDYAMSQRLAAVTGVPHASPQILMLRGGAVAAHTSHEGITVDQLAEMVASAGSSLRPRA